MAVWYPETHRLLQQMVIGAQIRPMRITWILHDIIGSWRYEPLRASTKNSTHSLPSDSLVKAV